VSPSRRTVRATARFFEDLDRQTRTKSRRRRTTSRCSSCSGSSNASLSGSDGLPTIIPGRDDYRILIAAGSLVAAFSVIGQLAPDGAIELVQLDIDFGPAWS